MLLNLFVLKVDIEVLLSEHPDQTCRGNDQWTSQSLVKLTVLEAKPFGIKVATSNHKCPDTEIVHLLVTNNVIGAVKSDDRRQKGPGTEGSGT